MAIAHPRAKLITCIVPAGEGFDVASGLNERFGLTRIGVIHGRGASQRSGTFADEMDILNVVAEPEEAETVFAWLWPSGLSAGLSPRLKPTLVTVSARPPAIS